MNGEPPVNDVPVVVSTGRALAPMQRPLWTSQRRHRDAPVQNMALLTHIDGPLDPGRLWNAFALVVESSDVLRTRIIDDDTVRTDAALQEREVVEIDRNETERWAATRAAVPIDCSVRGYDSAVLVHPDGTASWYLALHHTITDATSSSLVFDAVATAYHGESVEPSSFYRWVDSLGPSDESWTASAAEHWRQRSPAVAIDRLYQPLGRAGSDAARIDIAAGDDLLASAAARLQTDYRMISDDLAWSALLMTVTSSYLSTVSGHRSFALGLPVHNRSSAETRALIGPLMEVFPVDVTVEPGDTFRSLHKRIGRSILTTLANAVPGTAPAADYPAVVNVIARAGLGSFGSIATTTRWVHAGAIDASHLLRVQFTAYDDTMVLDLNRSVAGEAHVDRARDHFRSILAAAVGDPDQAIAPPALNSGEQDVLEGWESSAPLQHADEPGGVVARLRAGLADRTTVALTDGDRSWAGADLWADVVATARALRAQGVEVGDRVGVDMPRSGDAVVAILATLVAGGSFVPLDPTQPEVRRRRLAERAGCRLVLTGLPHDDRPPMAGLTDPAPSAEAYLLFTSGSTGEPKGVPITHDGLARYLRFAEASYLDGQPLVVPLFSALTFDLTLTSLFLPLLAGGELIVIGPDGPTGLAAVAAETRVTWAKATPSHLEVLVRLAPDDHQLRALVVGGEAFGAGLARRLLDRFGDLAIFNEYGPTEAVVGCMIHRVDRDRLDADEQAVPIGRPAPGVTLRIADDEGRRVPVGAAGELLISHPGLAAGYLGGDGADRFIELDGRRFYRSGDLVRLAEGAADEAIYLGRIDEQVKVGGIRLEPTEVSDAIVAHPAIEAAAVGLWTPTVDQPTDRCVRCGLASNVPGVALDEMGVCSSCYEFDRVAPQVAAWFKTPEDLATKRDDARNARTGRYDCLHLLSGGKDSTYALYRLVELGFEPYVLTLDNGFISEQALDNASRTVTDLGLDHEVATTEAMNDIFRDSLERHSNVCHGCYKTLYTLATNRAVELGIPMIVTGLSRGQLFETRLLPRQFGADRFDPEAIDRAVVEARKAYHRVDDGPRRLLDTDVFADDELFERMEYVDFYRYVDVELSELYAYLDAKAPWARPTDTGRSTNCLINAAGIFTHQREQGYHNYAIPYAWDVRLGHKTRAEAIDELDDRLEPEDVAPLLSEVGYTPNPPQTLTAWVTPAPGYEPPTPAELRAFLVDVLPAHAIPRAFVVVDELPLTANGKLDAAALAAPERIHRPSSGVQVAAETELEATIVGVWERILQIEPIGVDDDFFALGGDSLAALEMSIAVGDATAIDFDDDLVFVHTTPRDLATILEGVGGRSSSAPMSPPGSTAWTEATGPPLSPGEQGILFDQATRPEAVMYNVGRLYRIADNAVSFNDVSFNDASFDAVPFNDVPFNDVAFERALRTVAQAHVPLSWSYGSPRRRLSPEDAVEMDVDLDPISDRELARQARAAHQTPFDLERGPLLRAMIRRTDDGTTAVLVSCHHVSGDAESFDRLWPQVDAVYSGRPWSPPDLDYPTFVAWQQDALTDGDRQFWLDAAGPGSPPLSLSPPAGDEPDGYLTRTAAVSPRQLQSLAGTSSFSLATAAVATTLSRYRAGADDPVELAMITSSRSHPVAEPLVGYFLNALPLAIECRPDDELGEVVARTTALIAQGLAHRTYPYARMVADRRRHGMERPSPEVLVVYEKLPTTTLAGASVTQEVLSVGTAVADATFFITEGPTELEIGIEYRGSIMSRPVAERLLADVDATLRAVVDRPTATVGAVELPSAGSSVLAGSPLDPPPSIVPLIERWFSATPDAPAVSCGGAELSWAELEARCDALMAELANGGVDAGDRVLVCLPRSVDLVAAIVATIRLGAAYVPIDPTYPAERIELLTARSGAVASIEGDLDGSISVSISVSDGASSRRPAEGEAYVIFTSGSTGEPRAVPVGHGQLAASTVARALVYDDQPERFLMLSSPSFDSSIVGLFWTLSAGGTVVLPTDREAHDPDALVDLFDRGALSHTLLVPTLYQALLERGRERRSWPRHVIVAGEACPPALVRHHHELRSGAALTNEYGPTEATVWATAHRLVPGDEAEAVGREAVPIGAPIPGSWVAVVDDDDRPLPAGVEGQLIIGGAGVVEGYDAAPDATAARFGENRSGRFFRTGDRAVVDGGLVFFRGRLDDQLNVGGARVEPEDIERVLLADDAVQAAIVTPDPDGRPLLVAHLEVGPERADALDLVAVRTRVAERLALSMRPAVYRLHEALPRTPNGKLDREAAAALSLGEPTADVSGATAADPGLAADFAGVLGLLVVEPDESFFDLGGHSLLALELIEAIERRHGVEITVSSLYDHPTPAALSGLVSELGGSGGRTTGAQFRYLVPIQPDGSRPPIFAVHVLGVDAEYFRPLAAQLGGDQPMFGLGQPTLRLDTSGPTDVAEVAHHYAAELNRCAPTGPVSLAAVSLGSVVAFELAQQLRAQGRTVELLVLFDAAGPGVAEVAPSRSQRASTHLRELRRDPLAYAADRAGRLGERASRRSEIGREVIRSALGLTMPDELRIRRFVEENWRSQLAYRYEPYDGGVVVFKAGDDPYTASMADGGMGWRETVSGPLEVAVSGGGHLSMLAEPHVAPLAAELGRRLDHARAGRDVVLQDEVETQLIAGLYEGRLGPTVERLTRSSLTLAEDAQQLLDTADAATRALAAEAADAAKHAVETLTGTGLDAEAEPVPGRLQLVAASVSIDDGSTATLAAAASALTAAGYRLQDRAPSRTNATWIRTDESTTRLRVTWPATGASWRTPAGAIGGLRQRLRSLAGPDDLGVFLGTPTPLIPEILALAEPGPDDLVVDLGCGDGRVVIEAARRFGCRARGVDNDAELVEMARRNAAEAGLTDRVEIVEADASDAEALADASIVFAFLPAETTAGLLPELLGRLGPGGRVVAHEQVRGRWPIPPDRSSLIIGAGITVAHVWQTEI